MIKRLGIWLLALVFMAPAVALAQTGQQVAFPNLGYDVGQWKYIIDGFYQGFFIFKMIAGRCDGESCSQALFYLALTAGLVGGLLFLLNPKFQQIPIIVSWVALVFILIIGPYNTQGRTQNLLFYTFGAEENSQSFAAEDEACSANEGECGITAFMPQLMVIHAISTIHQGLFQALYRCNEYGCEIRDPISEILTTTAFQGMRQVFSATARYPHLAYEGGLLRNFCGLSESQLHKLPYHPEGFANLSNLTGEEQANSVMLTPEEDASFRARGFKIEDVANMIRFSQLSGSTSIWPPLALMMNQEDYEKLRYNSLIGQVDLSGINTGGAAFDAQLRQEIIQERASQVAPILEEEMLVREQAMLELASIYNISDSVFPDSEISTEGIDELYDHIIMRSAQLVQRNAEVERRAVNHPSFLVGSLKLQDNMREGYNGETIFNRDRREEALSEFSGQFSDSINARLLSGNNTVSDMPVLLGLYRPPFREDASGYIQINADMATLGGLRWIDHGQLDTHPRLTEGAGSVAPHWHVPLGSNGSFDRDNDQIFSDAVVRDCADMHADYNARRLMVMLDESRYGFEQIARWLNMRPGVYDPRTFNIEELSSREKIADTYEMRFTDIYRLAPDGATITAATLGSAARAQMLNDMLKINYRSDAANIAYVGINYGRDDNVLNAVEDSQLGMLGSALGGIGNWAAEISIGVVANFVGIAATIYLNFIIKLIDLSMMAVLMFTPLFFLMGLLVPSHAPGLLILSVAIVLVLKMVPITIMLVNLCLSMIFSVIGVTPERLFNDLEAGILLFAAGGLYTGVVGLTLFILFKIGDTGNLQMIGRLDDGAKKIAESFEKVAYTLTALGASAATGGAAGMLGAANKAAEDGQGIVGSTAAGFKGLAVGAASQSTDVITKGLSQIPGFGGVGGEMANAWGQGTSQGKAVAKRGMAGYIGDHLQADQAQHDAKEDQVAYAAERARAGGDPAKQARAAMNNPDLNNYERLKAVESLMKMLGQSSGTVAFPVATENNPNAQFDNLLDALASTSKARQVGNGDIQKGTDQITSVMEEVVTKANGKMVNAAPEIIDNGDGTHTVAAKMTGEFKNQLDNDPALKAKFTGLLEAAGIDYDWEEGRIYTNGRDGVRLASTAARENAALQGGHSAPTGPAPGGGGGGQGGGDNSGGGGKGTTQAVQRSADSVDQSVKSMTDAMKNAINNLARDLVAASKEASDGMTRAAGDMQKAAKDISEAAQKLDKKE